MVAIKNVKLDELKKNNLTFQSNANFDPTLEG